MRIARWAGVFVIVSSCVAMVGCRVEPSDAAGASDTTATPPRVSYNVAPRVLHDKVIQAITSSPIDLKVVSDEGGRIVTDWKDYPGAIYGPVSGVGRHWQERTRFTITIAGAWDDPLNKSLLEIAEESQQRPHDKWEWGSQDPINRPARAADLGKKIDETLARASTQPAR